MRPTTISKGDGYEFREFAVAFPDCGYSAQRGRSHMVSRLDESSWSLACPVAPGVFRFAVAVFTVLASGVTWLSAISGKQTVWTYLTFGYMVAMLANVLIPHIAVSVAIDRKSTSELQSLRHLVCRLLL